MPADHLPPLPDGVDLVEIDRSAVAFDDDSAFEHFDPAASIIVTAEDRAWLARRRLELTLDELQELYDSAAVDDDPTGLPIVMLPRDIGPAGLLYVPVPPVAEVSVEVAAAEVAAATAAYRRARTRLQAARTRAQRARALGGG